jgi:hypothetical protein
MKEGDGDWRPVEFAPFDLDIALTEKGQIHSLTFARRRTQEG